MRSVFDWLSSWLKQQPPQWSELMLPVGLLMSATLILTACVKTTGTGGIDLNVAAARVTCEALRPISWSTKDTDETIREIKSHNAAWTELCGTGQLAPPGKR